MLASCDNDFLFATIRQTNGLIVLGIPIQNLLCMPGLRELMRSTALTNQQQMV